MLLENMARCRKYHTGKIHYSYLLQKDVTDARIFFSRLFNDLSAHFSRLGSALIELNLNERLKYYDFYRNGEEEYSILIYHTMRKLVARSRMTSVQEHLYLKINISVRW